MINLQLVPAQFRGDRRRDLMKKVDFNLKDHYTVADNKTLKEGAEIARDIENQYEEWKNDLDGILAEDENFYFPWVGDDIPIYSMEVYKPVAVSVNIRHPEYVWENGEWVYWEKNSFYNNSSSS